MSAASTKLLLVHGWPQTWYQWRLVIPTLASDFLAPYQVGVLS